jgi:hypothetical protein
LMIETHRQEARLPLDESCIQEAIEIETSELGQAAEVSTQQFQMSQ